MVSLCECEASNEQMPGHYMCLIPQQIHVLHIVFYPEEMERGLYNSGCFSQADKGI